MSESATDGEAYANAGGAQPGEPQHARSDRADLRQEPGAPHSRLGHFMRTMGHLRSVYGPAAHRDLSEEAPHTRNPEDVKESRELEGIDVVTDSEGHRYGVRRPPEEDQTNA
ncbi:hypothetical protein [Sinomonas terrae]|uniref:Uncharacterized protein n=1 Tax=Sinomonas terrae TaxID=2908838 RepID=A0ABS9U4H5_9MICC|nr:hypothetical protein [Sinomonas terrae]MCH6471422.1 hypothetical protein [Sinomonas terrae]